MIVVQLVLLKVALDYRSSNDGGVPFSGLAHHTKRPYNFWQWRSQKPYVSIRIVVFMLFPRLLISTQKDTGNLWPTLSPLQPSCISFLVHRNSLWVFLATVHWELKLPFPYPRSLQIKRRDRARAFGCRYYYHGSWEIS